MSKYSIRKGFQSSVDRLHQITLLIEIGVFFLRLLIRLEIKYIPA